MQIRLEQILICRYKRKMAAIQPHKYKIIIISGGLISSHADPHGTLSV